MKEDCIANFFLFISRYHLTIKDVINKKGEKLNSVIEALLDIASTRLLDRDVKSLESDTRFSISILPPRLAALREHLTPYGWNLVQKQSEKPTTTYAMTVVNISQFLKK